MSDRPVTLNGVPIPYGLPVDDLRRQLQPAGPRAWAACLALGSHTSPEAFSVLLDLLDSPDWRYRRSALEAVVHHPLAQEHLTRICGTLDDPSVYVRRAACEAAGKLKATQALPQLMRLLSSPDSNTRLAVLWALPNIWEPDLFEQVLGVFAKDPSMEVRKAAGWALMNAANETNWRSLFHIWKQDPVSRHRKWACNLAKQFGCAEVRSDLRILLDDLDGHVRRAAKEALDLASL